MVKIFSFELLSQSNVVGMEFLKSQYSTYCALCDGLLVLNNSCLDVGVSFYCSQCYQNIIFFWHIFFFLRLK